MHILYGIRVCQTNQRWAQYGRRRVRTSIAMLLTLGDILLVVEMNLGIVQRCPVNGIELVEPVNRGISAHVNHATRVTSQSAYISELVLLLSEIDVTDATLLLEVLAAPHGVVEPNGGQ